MNDTDIRPEKTAPPRPDVTSNQGYTIRAVLPGSPATPGLLHSWYVAAQQDDGRQWVTWMAFRLDGSTDGQLGYTAGHYFYEPDAAENQRLALGDLAVRAGLMPVIARQIAGQVTAWTYAPAEDKRMASRLLKWAGDQK
jgi:hypothetical protein